MTITPKTLIGSIDALIASDRGGWVRYGRPSVPIYFHRDDSPGLPRGLAHGTPVEFELFQRNGRPVAVDVRRTKGGNHADA